MIVEVNKCSNLEKDCTVVPMFNFMSKYHLDTSNFKGLYLNYSTEIKRVPVFITKIYLSSVIKINDVILNKQYES